MLSKTLTKPQKLEGKLFVYRHEHHRCLRVVSKPDKYIIYFEKLAVSVPIAEFEDFVKTKLLEVEEEYMMPKTQTETKSALAIQTPTASFDQVADHMTQILFGLINEDKGKLDVKQGRFALDTIKTMVAVTRLKMDVFRMAQKKAETDV